ncbi:MAG: CoA-disulfide reductase [Turicibacter sp.]|nr:CoA-disulfide reductase [Turicibacter sp.]
MKKLIVIGGVAAGMSAASKLKRLDPSYDIHVYEKGGFLSYGACGLPYYVSGENPDYRLMIARSREEFEASGIKTHLHHEVVKVIPLEKKLLIRDLSTGKLFIETYGKLMIATGATPILPPFPGRDLSYIYALKTLEDGILLKESLTPAFKNVVVVGGGYIGLEVVEAMLRLGKNVRVIERSQRLLNSFDSEVTDLVERHLLEKGVSLHLSETVQRFEGRGQVEKIVTDIGEYPADLVVLALGVKPATGFLEGSGIRLGKNGSIVVNRQMETSVPDVYAAGDCAEVYHRVLGDNDYLPLGTNANKGGRIAGVNISGSRLQYVGTLGSAGIKVCDLELGRTGLSENEARQCGYGIGTVFVKTQDHPAYYPNPTPLWVKLIVEKKTRKVLGAQMLGEKGAVLRIDVFAIAIHNEMTVDEIGMVDFVYAPPFAGVWDAVHVACNAYK